MDLLSSQSLVVLVLLLVVMGSVLVLILVGPSHNTITLVLARYEQHHLYHALNTPTICTQCNKRSVQLHCIAYMYIIHVCNAHVHVHALIYVQYMDCSYDK